MRAQSFAGEGLLLRGAKLPARAGDDLKLASWDMDRRRFLEVTIASGVTATASSLFGRRAQSAIARETIATPRYEIADWIAATPATFYRPYRSLPAKEPSAVSWIQVDLRSD